MKQSRKIAAALLALAAGFSMYAACFEPFGVAEFAYVFAVPAIIACRLLFENCVPESGKFWKISTFALSYAAWIAILCWIRHVYPPAGWAALFALPLIISSLFIWPWFLALPKLLPTIEEKCSSRMLKLLGLAGLWVFLEWLRTWIFSGFGWLLLADSQWLRPASIQLSEYGGVWIVSFTLIFCNLAIAEYIYRLYRIHLLKVSAGALNSEKKISKFSPEFYAALILVFAGIWVYIAKLPSSKNEEMEFRVGFVQTDMAGILKWDPSKAKENFDVIIGLTEALSKAKVDLILWPEAATPPSMPVVGYEPTRKIIEALSAKLDIPILMGNMAYFDVQPNPYAQNCAFFVSPTSGLSENFYAKKKLVPFGEYTPPLFSFIGKVVPVGNLKPGEFDGLIPGKIAGKDYGIGAMVCYEDIFPDLGRELALHGADLLFVCTNDSWYGREGGAWQHASHSALQAVSTRKVLLRSSNNGLSAAFDQYGRMRPTFAIKGKDGKIWKGEPNNAPDSLGEIELTDERGVRLDPETLLPARPKPLSDENGSIYFRGIGYADVVFYKNFSGETLYVKWGNWFVWLSALFAAGAIFSATRKPKQEHSHSSHLTRTKKA